MEGTRARSIAQALRPEDGVLAAWNLALPAVGSWLGLFQTDGAATGPQPFIGLVELLAILGAFAALLTRPSDQPPVSLGQVEAPRWVIAGPLIGGLAFVSNDALTNLGLESGDWIIVISFVVMLAGFLASNRLPSVAPSVRRVLVMPFVLICAAYFNGFAAVFLGGVDLPSAIASSPPGELGFAAFVLTLVVGGMAAFYAMFVVAPRELADPEDSGMRWVIRFALFVAASLLGIGWLAALGF